MLQVVCNSLRCLPWTVLQKTLRLIWCPSFKLRKNIVWSTQNDTTKNHSKISSCAQLQTSHQVDHLTQFSQAVWQKQHISSSFRPLSVSEQDAFRHCIAMWSLPKHNQIAVEQKNSFEHDILMCSRWYLSCSPSYYDVLACQYLRIRTKHTL